ncbi:Sugar kinase [Thioalkalivibrio nitratireducens DSM 14787]|uniref:Sugar kinase n=1 Tax=Thioalkalivibrio nitratireducens (strain DSM 14787 / UNIQEM 213 / ALEN2) TaxID=1255043 RepID=L0DZR6_THIND|nr:carbohydrate kinase family protein [Thioalkalivibrio nitratireducens]AGA34440.1 Sugar kinase [Thioalkalivibrio nitratireducens DSM 14787]
MSALICGSIAFDTIMVFPDRFKNHILPDKVHILNVSFLVPEMRREFGGCAGNIAYNLKLLGGEPVPMATVGSDFGVYAEWLDQQGIDRRHVRTIDGSFTGQAFITTDQDDNQITAFHPGAMNFSHHNRVQDAEGVRLGIVSPDGRDGMIQHAAQFAEAGIPFFFDVGQGLPLFSGDDLTRFLEQATYAAFNDYEAQLTAERTGLTLEQMAERVDAMIVTRGGEGSDIYTAGQRITIPAVQPTAVVDPTGCGDAYRAGLLYGLENGMDWETTGRIASLLGSIKIATAGTQNHHFTRDEFAERFHEAFGYRF